MYVHVDFSILYVQLYMSWERVSLHLLLVIFKSTSFYFKHVAQLDGLLEPCLYHMCDCKESLGRQG